MAEDSLPERRCKVCGQVKPIDQFPHEHRIRKCGPRTYYWYICKKCTNKRACANPNVRACRAAYQRQYIKTARGKIFKRLNRQAHAQTHNARCARWARLNPEKRRLSVLASEQARRIDAGWNKQNKKVKQAITEALDLARIGDKYLDAYTGELIDKPTIDHIVPISKGGTHDPDNLCVTSSSNNSSKADSSLCVWLIKRAQKFHGI